MSFRQHSRMRAFKVPEVFEKLKQLPVASCQWGANLSLSRRPLLARGYPRCRWAPSFVAVAQARVTYSLRPRDYSETILFPPHTTDSERFNMQWTTRSSRAPPGLLLAPCRQPCKLQVPSSKLSVPSSKEKQRAENSIKCCQMNVPAENCEPRTENCPRTGLKKWKHLPKPRNGRQEQTPRR